MGSEFCLKEICDLVGGIGHWNKWLNNWATQDIERNRFQNPQQGFSVQEFAECDFVAETIPRQQKALLKEVGF